MTSISRRPKRQAVAAAVSAAMLAAAMHAQAQENNAEGIQAQSGDDEEEVIVIGKRFQNSLINRLPIDPEDLPYSLDIIDESALHQRGFFNPLDILETLPNVVRRQTQLLPTGGSYLIRGLYGTVLTNNRPENDSRGSGRRDSSQIERIEVLKGPVSILLGPVIPGGVINQVSKSPNPEDSLELIARAGSFETHRVEVDANKGSLFGSGIWSGRVTVAYEDQRTPQDQASTETLAIRPVVEANFSASTRLQASVSYAEREGSPASSFPVNIDGTVPATIDEETYFGVPSTQKGEDTYVDLELQHEFLDNLKLVVRGSHQETDFDYQTSQNAENYAGGRGFGPGDTAAYVYYSMGYRDTEVDYGDVQLVGGFDAFGQKHDWVIGTSHQETKFASYWAFGGLLGIADINDIDGAVYGVPDFNLALSPFSDREDKLSSVYGETNLRPTDRLTIVAGARYDDYEQTNLTTGVTTPTSETTLRVGGTFELSDSVNAYASYAESFVPQNGTMRSGDPIGPETAVNHEIGLKGSFFDGRLALTTALFSLTRENVATPDPNNVPNEPSYVVPTGEQEHKGFELNANVQVTPALSFNVGYGQVDAEVTKVINVGSGENVGDPVALVPDRTYSAFVTYAFQDGPLADLKLGLGVRSITDRPAPRFDIVYDGYTLVDGLISYPVSERLDLQLNVHNLLDETYREDVGYAQGSPGAGHRFGNPRSAYLTLRAHF